MEVRERLVEEGKKRKRTMVRKVCGWQDRYVAETLNVEEEKREMGEGGEA